MDPQRRRLLAAGAGAALAGATFGAFVRAQPAEQLIPIVARKFEFVPAEVILKKGVPAVLEFTAPEVNMGFSAPDFKLRADLVSGMVTRVRIVPEKTGVFEYLCDVFCGDGHEDMTGKITVVD